MKEKTIDYVLRSTWIAVAKLYNEEANKKGSSMATGFALLSIDPENGTPSTALGPKMGVESTSLSRTLKTMEEKGLITREKNPNDGRSVLIHLTDFGIEMRKFSKYVVLSFDNAVKENISKEDLDVFMKVTDQINKIISEKKVFVKEEQPKIQ
ncbi:MarR family winged helix-turn-helix transcriptional regulator [Psychroflexus tropicus]|uniref:MarR family winged helix-turn-helix transcriptional regulator n=1 Tax=Psychroflexus tropicus TaxID=197345 RepID=UPI00036FE2D5|nr:MarR family transcriptional regulator [Psychroflexus tropicus]